jgi:hypothetical protein
VPLVGGGVPAQGDRDRDPGWLLRWRPCSAGRRSSRPNPSSVRLSVTLVRLSGVPSAVSRVEISAPVTLLRRERSDLLGNDPEAPSPTTVDRLRDSIEHPADHHAGTVRLMQRAQSRCARRLLM